MFTADVGKCVVCGGDTTSGAHKLCPRCSARLGQCEHCRAPLRPIPRPIPTVAPCKTPPVFVRVVTGTADGNAPAPEEWIAKALAEHGSPKAQADTGWIEISCDKQEVYSSMQGGRKIEAVILSPRQLNETTVVVTGTKIGKAEHLIKLRNALGEQTVRQLTDYPAPGNVFLAVRIGTVPSPKAAERAKAFKNAVEHFRLAIQIHNAPKLDPPLLGLLLAVRPADDEATRPGVTIDKAQAERIIDYLTNEGFLDQAADIAGKAYVPPDHTAYTMTLMGPAPMKLCQELGWNLAMYRRLEGLKTVLTGEAKSSMDDLLKRLAGYRRQWEGSAEGGGPAVRQGVQGKVIKLKGNFMPGPGAPRGTRKPLSVPVWVFKGQVKPFEKPNPRHAQLVTTVRSGEDGTYRVGLSPGRYTVVAEIDGRMYLNLMTGDGNWATVLVESGKWATFNIEDTSEAAY